MNITPWRNKRNDDTVPARPRAGGEDIFQRFFREAQEAIGRPLAMLGSATAEGFPSLDVTTSANEVIVRAELPGIARDDVTVEVEGDVLRISGTKSETTERRGDDEQPYYSERRFGSFRRTVQLPASVDLEGARAEFEDGLLTVRLPHSTRTKGTRIEVKGGTASGGKASAGKPSGNKPSGNKASGNKGSGPRT